MLRRLKGLLTATLATAAAGGAAAPAARPGAPAPEVTRRHLAFVLLGKAELPRAGRVIASFERLAPAGVARLRLPPGEPGEGDGDALVLDLGEEGRVMIGLVPAPVPKEEADRHAQWSLAGAAQGWTLPPHRAHVIVAWMQASARPPLESVKRFTWILAAVADASRALGVYWSDSGATHPADHFVRVAAKADSPLMVTLWSGLSIASDRGDPERMSLVSLGMSQLELPELELSAPRTAEKGAALGFFYDLLAYEARRGAAIPEGDTVGRSAEERLRVKYVRSPVPGKEGEKVWRVELPE
jgi:hypothetical protein